MKIHKTLVASFAAMMTLVLAVPAVVHAHDVLYAGTVLTVESERLHVKTLDDKTKKEEDIWFGVTKDTKVKRGDTILSYADARLTAGERVVVIVNHDAAVKNVATELRLAGK